MNEIYLKSKRAIRFLFYKHLSINEQLVISNTLKNNQLIKQYWLLNKADRHHSIEVMNRTLRFSDDLELLQLSLLHDIGKNTGHYSWLLRILSDLKIVSSYKSKKYLDHELIGLEVLSQIGDIDSLVAQYQKNLLQVLVNIFYLEEICHGGCWEFQWLQQHFQQTHPIW